MVVEWLTENKNSFFFTKIIKINKAKDDDVDDAGVTATIMIIVKFITINNYL